MSVRGVWVIGTQRRAETTANGSNPLGEGVVLFSR